MIESWPVEVRKRVWPSRALLNPTFLVEDQKMRSLPPPPLDPVVCRADYEESWARDHRYNHTLPRLRTGLPNNPPHLRGVVETLLARCEAPKAVYPLDVDTEVASILLWMCSLSAAHRYWITAGGLPFALRAMLRGNELVEHGKLHGYTEVGNWLIETREHSFYGLDDYPASQWLLLRALIAEAPDDVYAATRAVAAEALERSASGKFIERAAQVWIPFLFPDEEAWWQTGRATAMEVVVGSSQQKKRQMWNRELYVVSHYMAVAPIATVLENLGHRDGVLGLDGFLTQLAHRGDAALQLLDPVLAKADEKQRKAWCKDLLMIGHPGVVDVLRRHASTSKVLALALDKHDNPKPKKAKKKP